MRGAPKIRNLMTQAAPAVPGGFASAGDQWLAAHGSKHVPVRQNVAQPFHDPRAGKNHDQTKFSTTAPPAPPAPRGFSDGPGGGGRYGDDRRDEDHSRRERSRSRERDRRFH